MADYAILKAAQIPPGRSSQRQHSRQSPHSSGWVCDAPMRRCTIPYDFWRDDLTARYTGADGTLPPHTACQPVYMGEVPASSRHMAPLRRCSKVSWKRYTTSFYLPRAIHARKSTLQDRIETFYMLGSLGRMVLPLGLGFARAYAAAWGQTEDRRSRW